MGLQSAGQVAPSTIGTSTDTRYNTNDNANRFTRPAGTPAVASSPQMMARMSSRTTIGHTTPGPAARARSASTARRADAGAHTLARPTTATISGANTRINANSFACWSSEMSTPNDTMQANRAANAAVNVPTDSNGSAGAFGGGSGGGGSALGSYVIVTSMKVVGGLSYRRSMLAAVLSRADRITSAGIQGVVEGHAGGITSRAATYTQLVTDLAAGGGPALVAAVAEIRERLPDDPERAQAVLDESTARFTLGTSPHYGRALQIMAAAGADIDTARTIQAGRKGGWNPPQAPRHDGS